MAGFENSKWRIASASPANFRKDADMARARPQVAEAASHASDNQQQRQEQHRDVDMQREAAFHGTAPNNLDEICYALTVGAQGEAKIIPE